MMNDFTITTTTTRAELERSWENLSREEEREITRRQRKRARN
jgi:hypothetical protein